MCKITLGNQIRCGTLWDPRKSDFLPPVAYIRVELRACAPCGACAGRPPCALTRPRRAVSGGSEPKSGTGGAQFGGRFLDWRGWVLTKTSAVGICVTSAAGGLTPLTCARWNLDACGFCAPGWKLVQQLRLLSSPRRTERPCQTIFPGPKIQLRIRGGDAESQTVDERHSSGTMHCQHGFSPELPQPA